MRIGWFSPISDATGISAYSQTVLEAIAATVSPKDAEIIVFYPPHSGREVTLPFPAIELSDALLQSDFHALFDVAIYHIGNNEKHHSPIYKALLKHPGLVVLHDYVYQHFLAGKGLTSQGVSSLFGAMVHEVGGPNAFATLRDAGIVPIGKQNPRFTPWETEWALRFPMGDRYARLGYGAVVHSDFAQGGLGEDYPGQICKLFMPCALPETAPDPITMGKDRIHLVFSGHIQRSKGLGLLVSAFARVPEIKNKFKVTISGHPSDKEFLQTLLRDIELFDLESVFEIVKSPSDDQFDRILNSADIHYNLRFPNTEGASLSLAEQLATGRPVIAYRTGAFAEMPEDSCYFLDRVGEVDELISVLQGIVAKPSGIVERGKAAWKFANTRTPEAYANELMEFLSKSKTTIARLDEMFYGRQSGQGVDPNKTDALWVDHYVDAARMMGPVHNDGLPVPLNLFEGTAFEIGTYVCLNELQTSSSDLYLTQIGKILQDLPLVDALATIGLLRQNRLAARRKPFLENKYTALTRPIESVPFWQIVLRLPPDVAISIALKVCHDKIDPQIISDLIQTAADTSVQTTLRDHFAKEAFWDSASFWPIRELLQTFDVGLVHQFKAVALDKNLVADSDVTADALAGNIFLTGFYPPEPYGIWTMSETATLLLRSDTPIYRAELSYASLKYNGANHPLESVKFTDTTTNQTAQFDIGDNESFSKQVFELEGFSGLISIEFTTVSFRSPKELGLSEDMRPLGVYLTDLRMF